MTGGIIIKMTSQSDFFRENESILLEALEDYKRWFDDVEQSDSDKEKVKEIDRAINVINEKITDLRVIELEEKACAECWEYCYEQGFTKEEREEYDKLVYD